MHPIPNRCSRALQIAAAVLPLMALAAVSRADIFKWEYINPADPSQGKRQSTTLAPDGAGVDAVPGGNLAGRDLTMVYLTGANLFAADLSTTVSSFHRGTVSQSDLTSADLSQANLTNANFKGAVLTSSDFTGADIRGARFGKLSYVPAGACDLCISDFGTGISLGQLYSTASYQAHNLSGITFEGNDLAGGNFAGQNVANASFVGVNLGSADFRTANLTNATIRVSTLTWADFREASLTGAHFEGANLALADFTDADVRRANFGSAITLAQLYSTASYQAHDLRGIALRNAYFKDGIFVGQYLANAFFLDAKLTGADFTGADTRGAQYLDVSSATSTNLILPDGRINGLNLDGGETLVVRDYDMNRPPIRIPIAVDQHLAIEAGGTLRMVFEADAWDSTISFAPGIPVALGGTLELTFANNMDIASQIGRTLDLFDWTGVNPTGAFAVSSPYAWDLSNLYTSGEATLTAVPEPSTPFLLSVSFLALFAMRHVVPRRCSRILQIAAPVLPLVSFAASARADIFQWEYINPANPTEGKQQSTTLARDGAGVDAVSGAVLTDLTLTKAYLISKDLTGIDASRTTLSHADLGYANLTNAICWSATLAGANLSHANLTHASFNGATLTGAEFTGAEVRGANFRSFYPGPGITLEQLYSTASYQAHDLSGIGLSENDLAGANFAGQNLVSANLMGTNLSQADLTHANLYEARLIGADLTGAEVRGANFSQLTSGGISAAQLYSTASYQVNDLTGIQLGGNNMSRWNLAGQNLTNSDVSNANLTGANFAGADMTGAEVRGANFDRFGWYANELITGTGITSGQLYSTASYQARDLAGINLGDHDLSGWSFAGQNIANADFASAKLPGTDFTGAVIRGASFTGIGLTQLYSTASYQAHDLSGINLVSNAFPAGDFAGQDLTNAKFQYAGLPDADFREANLTNTNFYQANLTGANFAGQDLTSADLTGARLTNADLTGAQIRRFGIILQRTPGFIPDHYLIGTGITPAQLYSTANYQARDLSGIDLQLHELAGANFAGQNLTHAHFGQANLAHAQFDAANLTDANFGQANLTNARFNQANLTRVNLAGQNLTSVNFDAATLTYADFSGAEVRGASFSETTSRGFTAAQFYSTASYQARDLTGVGLAGNDLSSWNFAGQNLTNANFDAATLTGVDFREANLTRAVFDSAIQTGANFANARVEGANLSGVTSYGFNAAQLYSTASYQGRDLTGIILTSNDLSGWNFAGQNLTSAVFGQADSGLNVATMIGADFSEANLTNATFGQANLTGANFRDGNLTQANFHSSTLSDADFREANLTHVAFDSANLTGANFAGQDLTSARFDAATLTDADFSGSEVRGARFSETTSRGFTAAQLYSTASYQARDLTGMVLTSNDLSGWNFAGQNLTGAEFGQANSGINGATLTGADFREANLTNATFGQANLTGANFRGGNLTNANFHSATLTAADFRESNLTHAVFDSANLTSANFAGQILTSANFDAATLTDADFHGADVRGARFSEATSGGFTAAQLDSTASYEAHDLTGIILASNDLSGWNFAGQNLTNAHFDAATLTGANFANARVQGANLSGVTSYGFNAAQLYSTASYQGRDLTGIILTSNDLSGWNFAGQNLTSAVFGQADSGLNVATMIGADFSEANLTNATFGQANLTGANFRRANLANANFQYISDYSCDWGWGFWGFRWCFPVYVSATLTDADLTAADARGALGLDPSGAANANLILSDGHINGLDLEAGGLLMVRDYDGSPTPIPITVDQHLAMGPGGALRMVFEADAWDSTISFAPGIPVTLGGTLELAFADDVTLPSQVGRTFDVFDWTAVNSTGAFAVSSPYVWDLSSLYTTGEVTLTAVPEPGTATLLTAGLAGLMGWWGVRRRRCVHASAMRRRKLGGGLLRAESLEPRAMLAANLQAGSIFVSDSAGVPITDFVVGEQVNFTTTWTSTDLTASRNVNVQIRIDGALFESFSRLMTTGANQSYQQTTTAWYARPGENTVEVRVDSGNVIAEADETDNAATFTFTPLDPNLANKFVDPIGGEILRDWAIFNYVDMDSRSGSYADFRGGHFTYDGHFGHDIVLSQLFPAMDRGLGIFAVADGTVIVVGEGNFDREVTQTPGKPANGVILDHGNGFVTLYGHMATNTVAVNVGDHVSAGQLLGMVGSSGFTDIAHLHFQIHHNDRVVEPAIAPDVYWAAPSPYSGDLPATILVSGITNYALSFVLDISEGPSRVSVFPTSATWNVTYSVFVFAYDFGDPIQVRWYRPDGSLERSVDYQPPGPINRFFFNQWNLEHARWSQFPGSWQVALVVNGTETDRQSFEVTTGPGVPEIRLTQGTTYVIDGRTTPIDFGTASGASRALTFAIQNHGSVALTLSDLQLPPGFSPVGAFPTSVAAGSTANFTVQLDATVPGDKFGQFRFRTNDADESEFEFNIKGVVSGLATVGSPQIVLVGPAVPYINSSAPQRIAANATVSDADSVHFGSGSLTAELAFGATADDRLGIAHVGTDADQIGTMCGMVTYGGVPIGSVTGGAGAKPLVINFTSAATLPAVQALVRNLTFANVSPQPATHHRYVRLTLVDETGKTSNLPIAHVVVDPRPASIPAASAYTRLGAVSAAPAAGPVVINEVMYHPAAGDAEFIELFNITNADVPLGGVPDGWALAGAVSYDFPAGTILPASGYLLVTPIAPDVVRTACDIPADVSIVGPYEGELPDEGLLELTMPGSATDRIVVESLAYSDQLPWPTEADGGGASLSRYSPLDDANDAANWRPGVFDGTPGLVNRFLDSTPPETPGTPVATAQSGAHVLLSWAPSVDPDSGVVRYHVLRNGIEVAVTTGASFVDTQAALNTSYSYRIVAENATNIRSAASGATPLRMFTINNLAQIDATHLRATFSEAVTAELAQIVANYMLSATALFAATLEAGGTSVLLETATPMQDGTGYRVVANHLLGTAAASGSVIQPDAQRTMIAGVANGLLGEYYDDPASSFATPPATFPFGTKIGERIDATINYFWLGTPTGFVPPLPATSNDTFGVRWLGRLVPPVTGTYTFSLTVTSGDGVRLWIDANKDGQFEDIASERIIDAWPTTGTLQTGTIDLVANHNYAIRLDFYDNTSTARVQLNWSYPGQATPVIVPSSNLNTPTLIETERPNVTRAKVSSTAWTREFHSALAAAGIGSGGVEAPLDGSTLILPWANLNRVSLTFDEDVNVGQDSLLVNGVNVTSYGIAGFDYDYATYTATWTIANPLPNDRVTLALAGSVLDLVGNSVEGPTTTTLLVLPGDVNQSGAVDQADFRENLDRQFSDISSAVYSVLHDTDGNGAINIQDWHNVRLAMGDTLPPPPSPPLASSAAVVSRNHFSHIAADRPARLRTDAVARLSDSAIDQIVATPADSAVRKLRASRVSRPPSSIQPAALDVLFTIP